MFHGLFIYISLFFCFKNISLWWWQRKRKQLQTYVRNDLLLKLLSFVRKRNNGYTWTSSTFLLLQSPVPMIFSRVKRKICDCLITTQILRSLPYGLFTLQGNRSRTGAGTRTNIIGNNGSLVPVLVSLHIRSMWETICDAQTGFWLNSKFLPKFSRKPLSGISDQKAPPPPFRKTSDLRWQKFTPEYPPPPISENFRFEMTKVYSGIPPPLFRKMREIVCGD